MRLFQELGRVALGSRIRFLGDAITGDAAKIYELYGITMNPKWFPVFYVLTQDREMTVTAIAEDIGHSHVSVSKIVNEMMTARLVKLKSSSEDRRRTMVSLTKAGEDIARKIEDQYVDVNAAIEELSKQSKNDLWKALEEWERLLAETSLLDRVRLKKSKREGQEVQIVPYQKKYQKAFRDLNLEWIKKYFKVEQADRDALDDPEGYILERGGKIFVALLHQKPVGVCALLKRQDKRYPYELAKMAVSPKAQGKGAGFLLGRAVIDEARRLQAQNLFLESNTILTPAIKLYEKLGFVRVEGLPTPYERCNIQMELNL